LKIGAFSIVGGAVLIGLFLFGLMQNQGGPVGQVYEFYGEQCLTPDEWVPLTFDVTDIQGEDVQLEIFQAVCGETCGEVLLDEVCIGGSCEDTQELFVYEDGYTACLGNRCDEYPIERMHFSFEGDAFDGISGVEGTIAGQEFISGIKGSGIRFDVENEHFVIPYSHRMNIDNGFTWSFFVFLDELSDSTLFMKHIPGSGLISNLKQNGTISVCFQNECVYGVVDINKWTHLAITHDGNEAVLLIDGSEMDRKEAPYIPDGGDFFINGLEGENFKGKIDEVYIATEMMEPQEIMGWCQDLGGCGSIDTDGDGIPDHIDECPNENFDVDYKGCDFVDPDEFGDDLYSEYYLEGYGVQGNELILKITNPEVYPVEGQALTIRVYGALDTYQSDPLQLGKMVSDEVKMIYVQLPANDAILSVETYSHTISTPIETEGTGYLPLNRIE